MEKILNVFTSVGFRMKTTQCARYVELVREGMSLSIEKNEYGILCLLMDNFIVYFNKVEPSPSGLCLILKRNNVTVGLIDLPSVAEMKFKYS